MLKLGTHNSMTYLKPTGLVQIIAWNTGKCQNLSLKEQYEFGVRFFDLRIRFDEEATPYFAHGLLEFHEKGSNGCTGLSGSKAELYCEFGHGKFWKSKRFSGSFVY